MKKTKNESKSKIKNAPVKTENVSAPIDVGLPAPSIHLRKSSDKSTNLILKNVRLAFVSVAVPKGGMQKDKQGNSLVHKYEVTALIPKASKLHMEILKLSGLTAQKSSKLSDTVDAGQEISTRKAAIINSQKIGVKGCVIKDGDLQVSKATKKPYDGLAEHYTVKFSTYAEQKPDGTFKPTSPLVLVRADRSEIRKHEIESEIYSGVWADLSVSLCAYSVMDGRGVTAYLNGIQKLVDDTRLNATNPFEVRDDVVAKEDADVSEEDFDFQ